MNTGQAVIKYVNEEVEIGCYVTRQDLFKYVDKLNDEHKWHYNNPSVYGTIDTYRRLLQLNNILGESDGSGSYIKYHNVPEGETFNSLRRRIEKGDELFKRFSIMTAWKEGNDI